MKLGPPLVQIVKVAAEFHSFACRWYVPPSSSVTWSFAPPFWFVVQFVMPEGGGGVDAGVDVTGAGVVVTAVGVGLGDEDGLDTGLEEVALGVGVAEDSTLGARFADALGDGRKDPDGLDVALGDDA